MEPVLFYGVPSGCSFGSIVALEWLGKPYRLSRVEMMKEDFMAGDFRFINPVGETPAFITETGVVLTESAAILSHIGTSAIEAKLSFPQGTAEFDHLNQVIAFLNTTFFGSFGPLWYAYEHGGEETATAALRDYGRVSVLKAHADLERMLGDKEWLLGDHKTLADAYFVGIARWADYHDCVDRKDYPNVARLFNKLEKDPAVQFAHSIEDEQPAQSTGGFLGHVSTSDALKFVRAAGERSQASTTESLESVQAA